MIEKGTISKKFYVVLLESNQLCVSYWEPSGADEILIAEVEVEVPHPEWSDEAITLARIGRLEEARVIVEQTASDQVQALNDKIQSLRAIEHKPSPYTPNDSEISF